MFHNEDCGEDEVIMFERPDEDTCSIFVCKHMSKIIALAITYKITSLFISHHFFFCSRSTFGHQKGGGLRCILQVRPHIQGGRFEHGQVRGATSRHRLRNSDLLSKVFRTSRYCRLWEYFHSQRSREHKTHKSEGEGHQAPRQRVVHSASESTLTGEMLGSYKPLSGILQLVE